MNKIKYITRGMTLVELLAVSALSALVLTAMLNMLTLAQQVKTRAELKTRLALVAQNAIAEMQARDYDNLVPGEREISNDYIIPIKGTVSVTMMEAGLKRIDVRCGAQHPRGEINYHLTSLRAEARHAP